MTTATNYIGSPPLDLTGKIRHILVNDALLREVERWALKFVVDGDGHITAGVGIASISFRFTRRDDLDFESAGHPFLVGVPDVAREKFVIHMTDGRQIERYWITKPAQVPTSHPLGASAVALALEGKTFDEALRMLGVKRPDPTSPTPPRPDAPAPSTGTGGSAECVTVLLENRAETVAALKSALSRLDHEDRMSEREELVIKQLLAQLE